MRLLVAAAAPSSRTLTMASADKNDAFTSPRIKIGRTVRVVSVAFPLRKNDRMLSLSR